MLICEENQTILERHKNHCKINNIPYSNSLRGNQKRFTGLHFFNVFEYYENIDKIIEKKYIDIKNKKIILSNKYRNEHLLYDIIKESKMDFPKKESEISIDGSGPHHGLHLGLWRGGGIHESNTIKTQQKKEQILKDNYLNHYIFFKEIEKDEKFLDICKKFPLKEIENMKKYFKKNFNL